MGSNITSDRHPRPLRRTVLSHANYAWANPTVTRQSGPQAR